MKRVFITGAGAVSPTGIGIDEIWEATENGESGLGYITRFDVEKFEQGKGDKVRIAGEVDIDFEKYLTKNGRPDKKLIKDLDRFCSLGLVALNEAVCSARLEDYLAREDLDRYRLGAALGTGIGGQPLVEKSRDCVVAGEFMSSKYVANAMPNSFLAQGSGKYGLMGPPLCLTHACASGAYNTAAAFNAIRLGVADLMFAGAAESDITPVSIGSFNVMKALNKSRQDPPKDASRPFDRDRSGFVMGEGAGIIVLETEEHIKSRNAENEIIAEMIGYGTLNDTYHITLPNPSGEPLRATIQMALDMAKIDAHEVDYINAHGTSTVPNDALEAKIIKEMFGEKPWVSSTKSMTGHLLGAASALEQVYCALSHTRGIPPNINLENVAEECVGLKYATDFINERPKIVMNLSNGFGGHLAAILTRCNSVN